MVPTAHISRLPIQTESTQRLGVGVGRALHDVALDVSLVLRAEEVAALLPESFAAGCQEQVHHDELPSRPQLRG